MKNKIVNKTILNFVDDKLYLNSSYGTFLKVLFEEYKMFSYQKGEKPLSYKKFRVTLEKILENKIQKTTLVKKNNCYFLNNVSRKTELVQLEKSSNLN